ncbi:hypothetical protein [Sandaracinus amylolyticus]|uniref:Uncharacterized protein n=1 Tax=Sandaracinus amylolyticus TaxID=927083 RepID=A0A0F6SGH1_9BACT|nr:hypothetical protein [Sandaracinus amylolyticus]AKF08684.1 hypothetical protein DB32_005833 [Sandaracinus amylolyticus]
MRLTIALSAALIAALAAPAAAQDTRSGEVTTYDFIDGDLVQGGRYEDELDRIFSVRGRARRTLIHPRTHFVPEMLKSVEHL